MIKESIIPHIYRNKWLRESKSGGTVVINGGSNNSTISDYLPAYNKDGIFEVYLNVSFLENTSLKNATVTDNLVVKGTNVINAINTNTNSINTNTSNITNNKNRIDSIVNLVNTNTGNITTNKNKIDALEKLHNEETMFLANYVVDLEQKKVDKNTVAIDNLQKNHTLDINTLTASINNNSDNISYIDLDIYDINANLNDMQSKVAVFFEGFVRGVTIEEGYSAPNVDKVLFDRSKNRFVCLASNGKYYTSWFGWELYNDYLSHLKTFLYNGHLYHFIGHTLEDLTERYVMGTSKKVLTNITFPPSGLYQIDVANDGYSYKIFTNDANAKFVIKLPNATENSGYTFSFFMPFNSKGEVRVGMFKPPQFIFYNGATAYATFIILKGGVTEFFTDGVKWYQLNNL